MRRGTWIVVTALAGLVACPMVVMLLAVALPPAQRDLVFTNGGVPVLVITGVLGVAIGAIVGARLTRMTPRRQTIAGAVCGTLIGAALMGILFLVIAVITVANGGWPDGGRIIVTGAIIGAFSGGLLGGAIAYAEGEPPKGATPNEETSR